MRMTQFLPAFLSGCSLSNSVKQPVKHGDPYPFGEEQTWVHRLVELSAQKVNYQPRDSHFSCILQSSFELFQLKLLEQRWANFLEQSFPTEPCLNFRFMNKINLYYDPSPLGFGVDCYTIMHSQDNTHTHMCISGQLSVLFSILRTR